MKRKSSTKGKKRTAKGRWGLKLSLPSASQKSIRRKEDRELVHVFGRGKKSRKAKGEWSSLQAAAGVIGERVQRSAERFLRN